MRFARITNFFRVVPVFALLILAMEAGKVDTSQAQSNIFRYQDRSGRYHYVDDPSKIPEEFRKNDQQPHVMKPILRETAKPALRKETQAPISPSLAVQDLGTMEDALPSEEQSYREPESSSSDTDPETPRLSKSDLRRILHVWLPVFLVVLLINMVALWILLERADMPGIGVIVPIYNIVLISRLGGYSGWWVLWFLVPAVGGAIYSITVNYGIAKNFGKGTGFAVCAALLPFIFIPILAFSPAASEG